MKKKAFLRGKLAVISKPRWTSYATASAATALGCAASAEADVTYSGLINHHFNAPAGGSSAADFQLDQPGHSFFPRHLRSDGGVSGAANFLLPFDVVSAAVAGFTAHPLAYLQYASKLSFGQSINTRPFVSRYGRLALYYDPIEGIGYNAQWLDPGTGFVGFRFNSGEGLRYGWARIDMDGAPGNSFTLIDYAFGDVGDRITAGQTSVSNVPDSAGSLGLLAIGCAGLLAWRARRSQAAD
ncbi:MAG: hypothetical protein H0X73_14505 [Chthoniobacterales bacterium]|nr:hypothetical protein [Chthoniobacterales bacterium]